MISLCSVLLTSWVEYHVSLTIISLQDRQYPVTTILFKSTSPTFLTLPLTLSEKEYLPFFTTLNSFSITTTLPIFFSLLQAYKPKLQNITKNTNTDRRIVNFMFFPSPLKNQKHCTVYETPCNHLF